MTSWACGTRKNEQARTARLLAIREAVYRRPQQHTQSPSSHFFCSPPAQLLTLGAWLAALTSAARVLLERLRAVAMFMVRRQACQRRNLSRRR
jgi:hypothetical protein